MGILQILTTYLKDRSKFLNNNILSEKKYDTLWYISSYEFARMMGSSLGLQNLCSYRFSMASQGACAQVRVKLVLEKVLSTTDH